METRDDWLAVATIISSIASCSSFDSSRVSTTRFSSQSSRISVRKCDSSQSASPREHPARARSRRAHPRTAYAVTKSIIQRGLHGIVPLGLAVACMLPPSDASQRGLNLPYILDCSDADAVAMLKAMAAWPENLSSR